MRERVGRILWITTLGWLLLAPLLAAWFGRDWYGRLALAAGLVAGPAMVATILAHLLEAQPEGVVLAMALGIVLRLGCAIAGGIMVTIGWPGLTQSGLTVWWLCLLCLYSLALAADVWPHHPTGPAGS